MKTVVAMSSKDKVSPLMMGGAIEQDSFLKAADVIAILDKPSHGEYSPDDMFDIEEYENDLNTYFVVAIEFDANAKKKEHDQEEIFYDVIKCVPMKAVLNSIKRREQRKGPHPHHHPHR